MFTQLQVKGYLDKETTVTGYTRRNYVDPYFMSLNTSVNGCRYNDSSYILNKNDLSAPPTNMQLLNNPITNSLQTGWSYDIYVKKLGNNQGKLKLHFGDATIVETIDLTSVNEGKVTFTSANGRLGFIADTNLNFEKVQIFVTNEGALNPQLIGYCNDFEGSKTDLNNVNCDYVELFGSGESRRDTIIKTQFRDKLQLKYQRQTYDYDKVDNITSDDTYTTITFKPIPNYDNTVTYAETDCLNFLPVEPTQTGVKKEFYTVTSTGQLVVKIESARFGSLLTDNTTVFKSKLANYLNSFPVVILACVNILNYIPTHTSVIFVTGENRILSNRYESYTITDTTLTLLKPNTANLNIDLANIDFIEEVI